MSKAVREGALPAAGSLSGSGSPPEERGTQPRHTPPQQLPNIPNGVQESSGVHPAGGQTSRCPHLDTQDSSPSPQVLLRECLQTDLSPATHCCGPCSSSWAWWRVAECSKQGAFPGTAPPQFVLSC